jgi:hypothetical protein
VTIHDMLGREAATLASGPMERGWHTIEWDAEGFPSGRYLCRVIAGGSVATEVVVKSEV